MKQFTKFAATIAVILFTGVAYADHCYYGYSTVDAFDHDEYRLTAYGNRPIVLYVDGDGDTDLDVYVYDENGNLIDCDIDETDYCIVSWTPLRTGPFYVVVENLGEVWNEYEMWTE